jgi:hypothetical protein
MWSRFFPAPVWMPLGGMVRPVMPLRLRDLGTLEAFASEACGTPQAKLAEAVALADPIERRAALRAAYDLAESGGVTLFSDKARAALFSGAGMALQVHLSLRKRIKGLTQANALVIANEVTMEQWGPFLDVAWNADPLTSAALAIDQEIGVPQWYSARRGDPKDLAKTFKQLIEDTGWTLETIGRLYLPQWDALMRDEEYETPVASDPHKPPEGWGLDEFREKVRIPRRQFWQEGEVANAPPSQ